MIIHDHNPFTQQATRYEYAIKSESQSTFWLIAKSLGLLLAISYFDAIIGGGIAEVLRIGGWSSLDQKVNDLYQFGFGSGVLVIMTLLIVRKSKSAILCAPLLVFYGEDVLYYLLQPLASPVIEFLIGMSTPCIRLPQEYSGWLGWTLRVVFDEDIVLLPAQVYLLNVIGVSFSVFILLFYWRNSARQNE